MIVATHHLIGLIWSCDITFEQSELELEVTEAICKATIICFVQYLNGLRMYVLLPYESECA